MEVEHVQTNTWKGCSSLSHSVMMEMTKYSGESNTL